MALVLLLPIVIFVIPGLDATGSEISAVHIQWGHKVYRAAYRRR
jgi:hypothetical protein